MADLLAAGATEAPTFAAVAAASDVVYICVTGAAEVDSVITSETGLLAGAKPGLIVVDTSTSEPTVTARLRALCAAKGVTLVDAPLARTPVEAEQGRLNTMVGAEQAVFDKLLPLFKGVWAENVVHVGGPGAGHTVKLLNNMLAMSQCTATAEAFAVGTKAGIDPKKLVEVITLGGVNSGLFQGAHRRRATVQRPPRRWPPILPLSSLRVPFSPATNHCRHGQGERSCSVRARCRFCGLHALPGMTPPPPFRPHTPFLQTLLSPPTMDGLKFELDNARKDIRYYTRLAESVNVPCSHGDAVLANLAMASALGYGNKFVPSLIEAQEKINGIKITGGQ